MIKRKTVPVKAHTRKMPTKKATTNKHGIKQNLTKRELKDRTRLKDILESARKEHKKYEKARDSASMKKRFAAFDKFWDASEKIYKRYGVKYPAL